MTGRLDSCTLQALALELARGFSQHNSSIANKTMDEKQLSEKLGFKWSDWVEVNFGMPHRQALEIILKRFTAKEISGLSSQFLLTFRGCGSVWLRKLDSTHLWSYDVKPYDPRKKLREKISNRAAFLEKRIIGDVKELAELSATFETETNKKEK